MMEPLEEQTTRERNVLLARINPPLNPHDNEFIQLPTRQPRSKERFKPTPTKAPLEDKVQLPPTFK